ncbi:AMP-binding protein [Pedobacter sp. NJ-S-72]
MIAGHFDQVLLQLANQDVVTPGDLVLLTDNERDELALFNSKTVPYAEEETFVSLFAAQVIRTPGATALVYENDSVTYQELDGRTNQLAHYLQSKGIGAGSFVPLCIERSLDMIIGLIGILKAGAAYVPVDPDFPQDRINHMLADTAAKMIVTSSTCLNLL